MAVPTFTSITPATGLTRGGNVVAIVGTNFRLTPLVPAGYAGGPEQQTVKVEIEGVRCSYAGAVSATEISCVIPEYRGAYDVAYPVALDVRISNLDDAGVEIVGENVTAADAYAVDRASLALEDSPFSRVIAEFVAQLRRHVHSNVWWTMSREYDETPVDELDIVKQAELPLIRLMGPETPLNPGFMLTENLPEDDALNPTQEWFRSRPQVTVDIMWTIDVWSDGKNVMELENLFVSLVDMFKLLPWLKILSDPTDLTSTEWAFEQEIPWDNYPVFDVGPELDGRRKFRCGALVRGVDVGPQDLARVQHDGKTYDASVPTITIFRQDPP